MVYGLVEEIGDVTYADGPRCFIIIEYLWSGPRVLEFLVFLMAALVIDMVMLIRASTLLIFFMFLRVFLYSFDGLVEQLGV